MLAGSTPSAAPAENRELAPAARASTELGARCARFPAPPSHYFEDHFGLRARLVRWQALLRLRMFGVSASPDVIVGRDGWLFYAGDGAAEDIASAVPFTRDELEAWRTDAGAHAGLDGGARHRLRVRARPRQARRSTRELLPASVRRVGAETRTDALVRYLRRRTRPCPSSTCGRRCMAAKSGERLYHRTDTHWNDRGAFAASQALLRCSRPRLAAPAPGAASSTRPRCRAGPRPGGHAGR